MTPIYEKKSENISETVKNAFPLTGYVARSSLVGWQLARVTSTSGGHLYSNNAVS